jgi:hypothetical protein
MKIGIYILHQATATLALLTLLTVPRENQGVPPDIEVDEDPKLARQGHDAQLEKAVEVVMNSLKKSPPPTPKRPPYPNYHKTNP